MTRCAGVIETTFDAMVAADVVGVSMTVAMHASVVVQVDAPYSTRRPYIPRESENHDRQNEKGAKSENNYQARGRERRGRTRGAETDCGRVTYGHFVSQTL
jgi:hypothetical protein